MPVAFINGKSIALLFLLAMVYSFLGWIMETIWCSYLERRFIKRGFLYGPICPIYGTGALIILLFLSKFQSNILLFLLLSIIIMSGFEYLIGLTLEWITGIKYWDYSHHKFNIQGRISPSHCLIWGALSFILVFILNPPIEGIISGLSQIVQMTVASILFAFLLIDILFTVRSLALMTKLLDSIQNLGCELREKVNGTLESAQLDRRFDELKEDTRQLREEFLRKAEKHSRRWRNNYPHLSSKRYARALEEVKAVSRNLKGRLENVAKKR